MTPFWTWWTDLGMPCWTGWPALGIAGVLVFAAACFAGLWLVARVGPKNVRKPWREWREAAEAWTRAREALREARAGVKKAATNLAAAKRRLKRMLRELQAAGKPPSTLTPAGDAGDAARDAMAEMEAEARQAVADAGRTLGVAEEEAHRRRGALAERGRDVRERARDACVQWRKGAAKCLWEIRRQVAGEKELEQLRESLRDYFKGVAPRDWKNCKDWKNWKNWKNLLTGHSYKAVGTAGSLLPFIAVSVDLIYYRHFDLDALGYYSSASLPALASVALVLALLALLTFALFLVVVVIVAVNARLAFWLLLVLAHLLTTTALYVVGVLPLTACRSTLCARLAAPGRGIDD